MASLPVKLYRGTNKNDTLRGTDARERFLTYDGNDTVHAGGGNDIIMTGRGNDTIYGGMGNDHMFGGPGADTFIFKSVSESKGASGFINGKMDVRSGAGNRDYIGGWDSDDVLHLAAIDANSKLAGNQAFDFKGKADFSHKPGELIYKTYNFKGYENDRTIVYGDVNGDGKADFQVELFRLHTLNKGDFIL